MTGAEMLIGYVLWNMLTGKKKQPEPTIIIPTPEPPRAPAPIPEPAREPKPLPKKPEDIPWPIHAGIPGAGATVMPTAAPGAASPISATPSEARPAPSRAPATAPPVVDEKQPTMQKGAGAVSDSAQRAIDEMRRKQAAAAAASADTGTGKRQYRAVKRPTAREVARAKELLGGWENGKVWRSNDDPSVIYKAVKGGKAGTTRVIVVMSSNPDRW